jgi:uncharacterized membrane protein
MMPNMVQTLVAAPNAVLRATRAASLGSVLGLIVLGLLWELWLAPTGNRTLALKVLPLAALVVGLLDYRLRTYRVACLLVWLYVAEGAVRAASDRGVGVLLAMLELALCAVLFAACAGHVRWRLAHAPEPR